ncbi:premnaspirodiene oxygenase-like [Lycium ferocissimum]|uniref:premnaspirodiene oxygenase-like n=1 Tax=Lycium ferocissimum TaxID=112874 RepID=UPI00281596B8|nr:premnaspirodiene oxygenase-like [Lycium ferocissimum]
METYSGLFNIISLLLFFSSLVIILVRRNKRQTRLPPGPWRLPLIGSLHRLTGALPHHSLRNLAQRYGPLMYLQLGQVPMVVISSPAIAKQVLKTHDLAFANRPESTSTTIIFYNNKDLAFSPYGNYWRQMRKTSMVQLFSAKMVKTFSAIRKDELSSLLSSIRNSMSMTGTSTVINITEKIIWFTSSIICRSVFGLISEDQDEFIANLKEVLLLSGGFDVADLFASWKLLHKMSSAKSKLVNAHGKVDAFIEDILKKHTKNGNKGNGEFGDEHLVDVLLGIKENSAQLQCPIINDDVKAVLFGIIAGGADTSSTIIIWMLSELMKNPNNMAKAQREVRQVFQGMKNYDEGDLEKLTYLKLVIKETLRLYPSIPLVPRECREQIDIDGYTIPHKTNPQRFWDDLKHTGD